MVDRLKRWWLPVVGIYGAARLFTFIAFLAIAQIQETNYWTEARPGYFDFLNIWDVEWYQKIYNHGYPSTLPTNPDGSAQNNEWAFYAGFPYFIRAVNALTGIEWKYLAPIFATLFGFAFILVAYKLLSLWLERSAALWSIALISIAWASPILQVGYAESLQLLLFAVALYAFAIRRDWLVLLSLALAAVTRPGVLAFALAFFVLLILRWRDRAERLRLIGLTLASGLFGFAWLVIAWLGTGRLDAYLQTENSWRAGYTGETQLSPFMGWFASGRYYLGEGIGQVAVFGVIALLVWMFTRPSTKVIGQTLYVFTASYLFYLLAVFFPQASTPRILLLAFGLLAALGVATVRAHWSIRVLLVAASLVGQVLWLLICWKYTAPDYTPP